MEDLRYQIMETHETTVTQREELLLLSKVMTNGDGSVSRSRTKTNIQTRRMPLECKPLQNRATTVSTYSGLFASVLVNNEVYNSKIEVEGGSSSGAYTRTKITCVFMPSFVSRHIDLQYLNTADTFRGLSEHILFSHGTTLYGTCVAKEI